MATVEAKEEGQLDSVLDSTESIVVVLDASGRIIRISRGVKNILGYDDKELFGSSIMTIVPQDRRDWMSAISKRAKDDGVVSDVFVHWRTRDGRRLITKSTMKSVVNYQQEVVGLIISEDTTAPKPQEGVLTPQQALQVVQSSEMAIIVTDLSGNVVSFSIGAERLTGFSPSKIIGSNVGRLFDDRSVVADMTTRGLRDGKIEDFETMIIGADGSRKEVSVSLAVQRNPSGAANGFSLVMFDISKRKELESELELRARKLRLVSELTAKIRAGKSLKDIYRVAASDLKKMVNYESMTLIITSRTDEGLKIVSFEGSRPPWKLSGVIPADRGPFAKSLNTRKPVVYTPLELRNALGTEVEDGSFRIGLVIPLYAGERDLGLLNLTSNVPSAFGEREIDLISLVADHIALAAESTRLLSALMENINIQTTLIETSTAVRSETDLQGAYRTAVSKAQELVSGNYVALYIQESGVLKLVAIEPVGDSAFPPSISGDNAGLIAAYYFSDGEAFIKDAQQAESASDQERELFSSLMMSKIMSRSGPIGLLVAARRKDATAFTQYEFELMNLFCNHLSPSLENALLFEDTRKSEKLARQALESERMTQEALHFLLDMFAHDLQNQIQGIYGYLELIESSDIPAEARMYLDRAKRQVRAGSYLTSGTAQVFKELELERKTRTSEEILLALKDAVHRFSLIFPNVELESIFPELPQGMRNSDSLLAQLFFHVIRLMYRATRAESIDVEAIGTGIEHELTIEIRAKKSEGSEKILSSYEVRQEEKRNGTRHVDPFLVRLLGEIYGAVFKTSERVGADGAPESVFTLRFETSQL
ncbi:MAG: PAS domain S-box protein [Thermoplasmata archaeon]